MPDEAIGFGSVVAVNDGVAGAFVDIDMVVSLGFPNYKVGTVPSKRLDLPDRTVIKLPTIKEGESLTITCESTEASLQRFVDIRDGFAEMHWRYTLSDTGTTTKTYPGILTDVKVKDITAEGLIEYDLMVDVSGPEI